MGSSNIVEMRSRHKILAELAYTRQALEKGYTNNYLHVDIGKRVIEIRPVTEEMKKLWVGGKGFDLWLMFQEINKDTKWDSPENPICFSSGPLGGTASFPGSGKTLVTAISPLTHSVIDSNVGGYFGPYLKFAGFDALVIVGKSDEDIVLVIDPRNGKITIETAPDEDVDSHLAAEEFTEMYAENEDDRPNIAVVSAGRAAEHIRMGVLNFSFYDWRRGVPRIKQAGRGGIGRVFRDKKLKALVVINHKYIPAWQVAENKVAVEFARKSNREPPADTKAIQSIIDKWNADPEYVIEMMQDIQDHERYISKTALKMVNKATRVPMAQLYHIATFYKAFSLEPKGEHVIQVCVGTTCHVKGAGNILDAFERELGIRRGETTEDGKFSLEAVACLGCCSLAPVVKVDDDIYGGVQAKDVVTIIKGKRG